MALATFTLSFPLLTLLSIKTDNIKATIKFLLPFTLLISILAGYVGFQQEPKEFVNNDFAALVFGLTALIASFKGLMYIQQMNSNEAISYSSLFKHSWRNFIIFGESWLFTLILWGILNLGASLFAILDIDFFKELLQKDWFVIPTLTLAFGFAVVIFRNITHTVDTIAKILQTLIKFLLPIITIVSIGFLATLPFKGLDKLWDTGSGSLLVLWLQALTLFFINAVYQESSHQRPYHKVLHRIIFVGVALLPIYTLISAYGLWLRVDQYGLTVARCWGILVCALLGVFAFGYLIGIVRKKDAWLETLSTVNIRMGVVVLVAMLLVNSPLLNFQAISTASHLAKLTNNEIDIEDLDLDYFRQELGRHGYLALQDLKQDIASQYPEKVVYIDRMYAQPNYRSRTAQPEEINEIEFEQLITYWPNKTEFPNALTTAVFKKVTKHQWNSVKSNNYYLLTIDLNQDEINEFIVITEGNNSTSANLWYADGEGWKARYMTTSNPNDEHFLKALIEQQNIKTIEPKWQDLSIGGLTLRVAI